MSQAAVRANNPSGHRRGGSALLGLLACSAVCFLLAPSGASAARVPASQPLVVLLHGHIARRLPSPHAGRIEMVGARRPLTRAATVLPVLGRASARNGGEWLRVRLPGRPNGHAGWISANRTRERTTEWHLVVKRAAKHVLVYRGGKLRRRFPAIVGKPSTPTPRGAFFVEEALALAPGEPGGPYALATSARSNVFQEFEGGPGQIGIHGTNGLSGKLGSASSHGCVRLGTRALTWLVRRVGAGVPLTITR
jgi:hypothetical protein